LNEPFFWSGEESSFHQGAALPRANSRRNAIGDPRQYGDDGGAAPVLHPRVSAGIALISVAPITFQKDIVNEAIEGRDINLLDNVFTNRIKAALEC